MFAELCYSLYSVPRTWNGTSDTNGRCTATISRNGDLVYRMYLEITGRSVVTANPGVSWIKSVELEIGGQLIDRHHGEWMNIWTELSVPEGKRAGYDLMVGNVAAFEGFAAGSTHNFDVPLQFWFCRNPGLALPLIALQYHEVKVILNHTVRAISDP